MINQERKVGLFPEGCLAICLLIIAMIVGYGYWKMFTKKSAPSTVQAVTDDISAKWKVSENPTKFTDCRVADLKSDFVLIKCYDGIRIQFVPAIWESVLQTPHRGEKCTVIFKEITDLGNLPIHGFVYRHGMYFARRP